LARNKKRENSAKDRTIHDFLPTSLFFYFFIFIFKSVSFSFFDVAIVPLDHFENVRTVSMATDDTTLCKNQLPPSSVEGAETITGYTQIVEEESSWTAKELLFTHLRGEIYRELLFNSPGGQFIFTPLLVYVCEHEQA
jgi:hypothetical protein